MNLSASRESIASIASRDAEVRNTEGKLEKETENAVSFMFRTASMDATVGRSREKKKDGEEKKKERVNQKMTLKGDVRKEDNDKSMDCDGVCFHALRNLCVFMPLAICMFSCFLQFVCFHASGMFSCLLQFVFVSLKFGSCYLEQRGRSRRRV